MPRNPYTKCTRVNQSCKNGVIATKREVSADRQTAGRGVKVKTIRKYTSLKNKMFKIFHLIIP